MRDFREILSFCEVHDLGFSGMPWTYDNKQVGDMNVKVRLDRAVATKSWLSWFPEAKLQHLVTSQSDHLPILLEVEHDVYRRQSRWILRYEIMWEHEPTLAASIDDA
jgi:hypothetical protein